ncbi:hypothetical protein WAK64_12670 [Bacillus spongiae]|uniref:Uncharacterized protein n=1 Tax=Bacillus spongiae TaxID=2683610 RepID=A0ABU8HFK1_9BACI
MEQFFNLIHKRKKLFWFITIFYIVFNGCFMFPFNRMAIEANGSLNSFLIVVISAYVFIALLLGGLVRNKGLTIFLLTLLFTSVGMVLRYILEYGEVSNTVNFTMRNIMITIVFIPLFVTLVNITVVKFNKPKMSNDSL